MKTKTLLAAAATLLWSVSCSFAQDVGGAVGDVGGAVGGAVGGLGGAVGGAVGGATGGTGSSAGPGAATASSGPASSAARSVAPAALKAPALPVQISLPRILRPIETGRAPDAAATAMQHIAGTSRSVLNACRATVAQAGQAYGLVDVSVSSYGRPQRLTDGGYIAPVFTRVTYQRQGGQEVRQAPIGCRFNQAGTVVGLTEVAG